MAFRFLSVFVPGVVLVLALLMGGAEHSAQFEADRDPPYRIIGYVPGGTAIWKVDASKLTHINYAFAQVNEEDSIVFRNDEAPEDLAQLQALKAQNPDLKLLVSVGGWGAKNFSDAALTDSSRATFARNAVDLVKRYGLDGIDIDWEFPGQAVGGIDARPADKQNFTRLLSTVRTHLDSLSHERGRVGDDRYLLTIASNDDQAYMEHTEMGNVHQYLDFVNIMTYDFFTANSEMTGHHTGLYQSGHSEAPSRTAAAAVERHLDAGIPPEKLVLGVAFYGRHWTGVRSERKGLNQPYDRFAGYHSYSTLLNEYINRQGFTRYWDESAKAPYLWAPDSSSFISYEAPESLRHKTKFVRENGLGGVMYWEHSQDYHDVLLGTLYKNLR